MKRANLINHGPHTRRMRYSSGWVAFIVLSGLVLLGCAPTTTTTTPVTRTLRFEVVVATDCQAGAGMIVTVDEVTHSFPTVEFVSTGEQELPVAATVRVPAPRGAVTYRVTVTDRCDDPSRTSIRAFRVDGDDRIPLGSSTTSGRSAAVFDGTK